MVKHIRSKERNEMNKFDKLNEVRSVNLKMDTSGHKKHRLLKTKF